IRASMNEGKITAGSGTLSMRAATRAHPAKAGAAKPRGQSDRAQRCGATPAGLPNYSGELHATVDPNGGPAYTRLRVMGGTRRSGNDPLSVPGLSGAQQ